MHHAKGSARPKEQWQQDHSIAGTESAQLHSASRHPISQFTWMPMQSNICGQVKPRMEGPGKVVTLLIGSAFWNQSVIPSQRPETTCWRVIPKSDPKSPVIHVRHARRYHCPWSCQCYHSLSKVVLVHHTTSRACQHWRFPTHGTPVGSRTGTCCP